MKTYQNIEQLRLNTKSRFPSLDRFEVAENEKIRLIEIILPHSINGVYYYQNGINVIAINKELPESLKKETFWHEYFHYHLSVGNYIFNNSGFTYQDEYIQREEYRANLFVSLLLIDSVEMDDTIFSIMDRYNVSEKIAEIRMKYELQKKTY